MTWMAGVLPARSVAPHDGIGMINFSGRALMFSIPHRRLRQKRPRRAGTDYNIMKFYDK